MINSIWLLNKIILNKVCIEWDILQYNHLRSGGKCNEDTVQLTGRREEKRGGEQGGRGGERRRGGEEDGREEEEKTGELEEIRRRRGGKRGEEEKRSVYGAFYRVQCH